MPYATSGDVEIYHEIHGDDGPAIVFAHGMGGNAAIWWQQVPHFSSTHRVIVFDHRGFGRSWCTPDDQLATAFEGDLTAVLDTAGVESAVVVCQSMGGWTGVRAAMHHSDRIDGVLLANTPGAIRNAATLANARQLAERLQNRTDTASGALGAPFRSTEPAMALLYAQISAFNTAAAPRMNEPGTSVSPDDVVSSGVPFHMVSSELDPLFPPDVLAAVAADIGCEITHVDGAGHSVYYEQPGVFNQIVDEFVASLRPSDR